MSTGAAAAPTGLPRQRLTAGVLIRDVDGRVLLVEPSYRSDWLTPGGSVEPLESPASAAAREVREELGLALPIGRLLALQWCHEDGEPDGVLHLTYDGGVVEAPVVDRFRLEPGLSSFRFVDLAALSTLASAETADRIVAADEAVRSGTVRELERQERRDRGPQPAGGAVGDRGDARRRRS